MVYLLLVAPCGAYNKSDFLKALAHWQLAGFRVVNEISPRESGIAYVNGNVDERYNDLCQLSGYPMMAVRGGYGALDFFTRSADEQNPSMLIGYSDVTIIHLQRFSKKGWIGIHGPNFLEMSKIEKPDSVEKMAPSLGILKRMLQNQISDISYPPLTHLHGKEKSKGPLLVMNLASLQSVIGLIDADFFAGTILAIEDINEPPYKIARMLTQLAYSGILSALSGLIFGQFHNASVLLDNQELFDETLKPLYTQKGYTFPVYSWPIFGHGLPNLPLFFGANVQIDRASDDQIYLNYLRGT